MINLIYYIYNIYIFFFSNTFYFLYHRRKKISVEYYIYIYNRSVVGITRCELSKRQRYSASSPPCQRVLYTVARTALGGKKPAQCSETATEDPALPGRSASTPSSPSSCLRPMFDIKQCKQKREKGGREKMRRVGVPGCRGADRERKPWKPDEPAPRRLDATTTQGLHAQTLGVYVHRYLYALRENFATLRILYI